MLPAKLHRNAWGMPGNPTLVAARHEAGNPNRDRE
jgi:hypothetical protein